MTDWKARKETEKLKDAGSAFVSEGTFPTGRSLSEDDHKATARKDAPVPGLPKEFVVIKGYSMDHKPTSPWPKMSLDVAGPGVVDFAKEITTKGHPIDLFGAVRVWRSLKDRDIDLNDIETYLTDEHAAKRPRVLHPRDVAFLEMEVFKALQIIAISSKGDPGSALSEAERDLVNKMSTKALSLVRHFFEKGISIVAEEVRGSFDLDSGPKLEEAERGLFLDVGRSEESVRKRSKDGRAVLGELIKEKQLKSEW